MSHSAFLSTLVSVFLPRRHWIIRNSHDPSFSVYPKLLFWHNFLCLLWILDLSLWFESDRLGSWYWSLRHLGTSIQPWQIIFIPVSKKCIKLFKGFPFHLELKYKLPISNCKAFLSSPSPSDLVSTFFPLVTEPQTHIWY